MDEPPVGMGEPPDRVPPGVQSPLEARTPAPDDRFTHFVIPEIEVLLRVAHTLTRDRAEAEDLVQDTLLRAFRAIDGFDGRHPRAWLLTILRNTNINRHRKQRPSLMEDPDLTMATVADTTAVGDSPEAVVVSATFDAAVESALDDLPDDFRRTIELVDIQGLPYAVAADALGVPVGTVMSRIHRARTRMRNQLASADVAPRSHS